ncbi:hypothetical protein [Thalassotalea sp. G2M2-11]|uniref:hypothetical protein n=1 Tax=Thalassotalea sp. G2M2-11 TaxID=2787627 RepID=UPI0019D07FBB|nr:hypothetical protein [Thalassotalea sp. G2M2-11]
MKELHKQALIKIFAEMISIVVAVLFALWANNWWAEVQRDQEVEVLTKAIIGELEEDLIKLEQAHLHHSSQLSVITQQRQLKTNFSEADYQSLNEQLYRKGVYQPADLDFTYWEILMDKGLIAELSNEQLRLIKPAYKVMKRYQTTWQTIAANAVNMPIFNASEQDKLETTDKSISQIWWAEKLAIKKIQTALKTLNNAH